MVLGLLRADVRRVFAETVSPDDAPALLMLGQSHESEKALRVLLGGGRLNRVVTELHGFEDCVRAHDVVHFFFAHFERHYFVHVLLSLFVLHVRLNFVVNSARDFSHFGAVVDEVRLQFVGDHSELRWRHHKLWFTRGFLGCLYPIGVVSLPQNGFVLVLGHVLRLLDQVEILKEIPNMELSFFAVVGLVVPVEFCFDDHRNEKREPRVDDLFDILHPLFQQRLVPLQVLNLDLVEEADLVNY